MEEKNEYENKLTLLFYEYFFLNGKKLKLDFNNGRVPTHVALDFIRNSLKDKIPDDFIFINDGKEIKRDEEDISYPNKLLSNLKPIHLFSESLYAKEKNENKIFSFDKFKVLEEKGSFKVLEYPQKENEEEIYYKIALIGNRENNANFIDGFLNFLLDIRKEDKYRFKLENNNKTNDFISKSYIQSEKGNFQFVSINLELDNSYSKEELSQMKEIFSNNLALIVFNKMDKSYEKIYRRDGTIQLIANHIYTTQKNKVFIVEPNIYLIDILFYYLFSSMEKYGGNLPINIIDEFIKTMETLKNHIFTCFLDFSCIYEEKGKKYDLCLFSQAIESYSYFYQTALKGENYKRRYMGFVFYLGDISSHLEEINKKCNDYQEKKQKGKENDLIMDEFLQELDKLNSVNKNLDNLYEDKANEIEYLQK